MPHYHAKIWLHVLFSTKHRNLLIHPEIEQSIYKNIADELGLLGCANRIINGMPDHIHSLFLLNLRNPLSRVIQQMKGSTSHWINELRLSEEKFAWQTGYAAFSVSESKLDVIHDYILHQKKHHEYLSFEEEQDYLLKLHNLPPAHPTVKTVG